MKPTIWWISSVLGASLVLMVGTSYGQQPATIQPNTPEAARTIELLKQAEYADRGNSMSWTADNPTLDHYYGRKAKEVQKLSSQLENGKAVSAADFQHALNTDEAMTY